ncbi:hypothetical protein TUN199_06358 [Pyrenophora tritici-repentis]|nr:hypothetical protein PtrV1_03703 [Pyrenophora tritici-repentis]KAI0577024.1 hypothetical protein Alg215_07123 [Pyrenophora tritici-repentis]KAI0582193.1 hypothetical protein Alg130_06233 [Pyrenophora tritici-repentis]KAI0612892.1 hypothetical protein TUN205_02813 [Pyrenophora tritici-repentis]KAI0621677.1 hypothetical protein TUN199_06358 [Pyrenophora tritici-repentis]
MKFTATLGLFLAALPLVYSHCCYRSDWAPGNQCAGSHDTESGESTHIGVCCKMNRRNCAHASTFTEYFDFVARLENLPDNEPCHNGQGKRRCAAQEWVIPPKK